MNENTIENHKLYRNGDYLAITINPADQFLNEITYSRRAQKFCSYWHAKLQSVPSDEYQFNLELSRYGRLHWHGYVKVDDPCLMANWVAIKKYKKNSNIDVDTVDDIDVWKKYIMKDEELHKKYTIKFPQEYSLRRWTRQST
jgi:hypothetical protein